MDFNGHFVENTQPLTPGEKGFTLRQTLSANLTEKVKLNEIAI